MPILIFGLLGILACKVPETTPPPPPAPRSEPAPKELLIQIDLGEEVETPEKVLADLQPELLDAFQDWGAKPIADSTSPASPVLRIHVKRYKAEPAGSPFAYVGLPGIAAIALGIGVAGAAGASDVLPIGLILGAGLAGTGLAAIIVGGILGGRQAALERQRGYPLQSLRVEARLEQRFGSRQSSIWEENYRTLSLRNAARPLSPEAAADSARVRRETLRALARCIKEDAGNALLKPR